MTRLIDADALMPNAEYKGKYDVVTAYAIANAPTIDAVEVVRCKDCKYRQGNACDYSAVWVRPNGFCHWGERKDDD